MEAKISDLLNFLSKLTLFRAINAVNVFLSYYYSILTKSSHQWGLPISIAIEPTTACNLACPECPSGLKTFTRETGNIKEDFFRKTIDELAEHIFYLTFYFQGEPYIHPKFLEMVNYASFKNIYTATSTNAHFLDDRNAKHTVESGLDRIIISIDGTNQETYQTYRIKGELDKVIEGTRNILNWKKKLKSKTPYVIFQFIVFSHNEHQVEEIRQLGKSLGVDEVKIKTAQVYNYANGSDRLPGNKKYSRYKKNEDGSYISNSETAGAYCWKMWHSCVISWDGLVIPCCFDKDARHRLGDLKKESFEKIWRNDQYRSFRSLLFKGRKEIDICSNCSEGAKVWVY